MRSTGFRMMQREVMADWVVSLMADTFVMALYARHRNDPLTKWKDGVKKVVGLERPTLKGLDL